MLLLSPKNLRHFPRIIHLYSLHTILLSNNGKENVWTLRKTETSFELDHNEELSFQLYFSDFGEKCLEAGERNVNWIGLSWINGADLQYKSHHRG